MAKQKNNLNLLCLKFLRLVQENPVMRFTTNYTGALAAVSLSLCGAAWSPAASACGVEPFLGEICIVAFTFEPRGYVFTHGQLMAINQNTALFALLGTTYGGNGQTTFQLPDTHRRA